MNQPRPARRQQLQRQAEVNDNNNENEAIAEAESEQPLENAIEAFVIDLSTQTNHMENADNNNNMNVVSDIRSLAAAIAADAAMPNCVDDVLILHYEQSNNNFAQNIHNSNNNNNNVESQLMHFNGIHIRSNSNNNNSYLCSCTNRFICDHLQSCQLPSPPDGSCDNARSCIFQSSLSAINGSDLIVRNHDLPFIAGNMHSTVADLNVAVAAAEPLEGVTNADVIHSSDGEEPLLLALESPNVGSINSAPVESSPRASNELASPQYLQHNHRQSRRRRRRRGRGRSERARQRHQIRRSLKSMNNILRKTAYTLRRIKSLIMQQLQVARDYRMNVAMTL